ncbi:MAG: hypothetical protein QM278_08445 [Pseudomonadota bacterium]|nr:hypothetical protein [Pseudomonadota bacterium]
MAEKRRLILIFSLVACMMMTSPVLGGDYDENIKKAVQDCRRSYNATGMSLMRDRVYKCYQRALQKQDKRKFDYCAAFDLSAYFVDDMMVRQIHCPPFEGFDSASVSKRIEGGLATMGYDKDRRETEVKLLADTTVKWFKKIFETD